MTAPTLCDYPGCDAPATNIAHGEGANTGPKEWHGCDDHRAQKR